ncbi:hypothetical protein D9758_010390 [Tetrapyrgos nigripes]|uniref:RRM domain-containing protein n=1 Tax=Tetrapyrgos nigripes TaxID=182062 RepID=A0A8H5FVR3_9AGAR|nr:hypothetical protein D9758_010390 [Tetrapyrgos nigripes]
MFPWQDSAPNSAVGIPVDAVKGSSNSMVVDEPYTPGARRSSRSRSPGDRGRGEIDQNPGNNLHVSGLSKKVDNRELEAAFAKVGRVQKVSVVYDPHTRESRGFAFVTMETPEEADAAVTALNATDLMGRALTVTKAKRSRARTPTPGKYHGPKKRSHYNERPYDPRPYDDRYRSSRGGDRDRDRGRDRGDRDRDRGDRHDDYRGGRGDRGDRYDDYGHGRGSSGGGGRDRDRDRGGRGRDFGGERERF